MSGTESGRATRERDNVLALLRAAEAFIAERGTVRAVHVHGITWDEIGGILVSPSAW